MNTLALKVDYNSPSQNTSAMIECKCVGVAKFLRYDTLFLPLDIFELSQT